MSKDLRISRNAFLRFGSSVVQPYNSADKSLLHEREDSKLKTSLQISVLYCENVEYVSPIHSLGLQVFLCTQSRIVLIARLVEFQKEAAEGSFGANRFSKTFPDMPNDGIIQSIHLVL